MEYRQPLYAAAEQQHQQSHLRGQQLEGNLHANQQQFYSQHPQYQPGQYQAQHPYQEPHTASHHHAQGSPLPVYAGPHAAPGQAASYFEFPRGHQPNQPHHYIPAPYPEHSPSTMRSPLMTPRPNPYQESQAEVTPQAPRLSQTPSNSGIYQPSPGPVPMTAGSAQSRTSESGEPTGNISPAVPMKKKARPGLASISDDERRSLLPYDPSKLYWNADRTLNNESKYCYCGDDRNLLDVDVQCSKCLNFFHGRCVKLDMGPVVPFLSTYAFTCRHCNGNVVELFKRTASSWKLINATTLANLILMRLRLDHPDWSKEMYAAKNSATLAKEGGWYSRKADMIPFLSIQRHWDAICTEKDKSTEMHWASKVGTALINNVDLFMANDEEHRNANSNYTLQNPDLFVFRAGYGSHTGKASAPRKRKVDELDGQTETIKTKRDIPVDQGQQQALPHTELPIRSPSPGGVKKVVKAETVVIPPERSSQRERPVPRTDEAPAFTPKIPVIKKDQAVKLATVATKDLARERKPTAKKAATVKKVESAPAARLIRRPPPYKPQDFNAVVKSPSMTQVEGHFAEGPYYCVTDIPYNKRGFKYTPCEAALNMPAIMYRQVEVGPYTARVDWSDMSPYMYLSQDGLSATTDKGFRMGRANVGAREGDWYWEVKVLRGNGDQGGHVRLGIARREASVDGPIGFDAYSYGVRDKGGDKLHLSRPRPFMESFGTGDVIGFHLHLPKAAKSEISRDRIPIRYRQQLYFEQYEYTASKDMEDLLNPVTNGIRMNKPAATLKTSFLAIYKNGERMGKAFEDLFAFQSPNCQTQRDQPAKDDGSLGYYPAVSVYFGGATKFNFGPDFDCPPKDTLLDSGLVLPFSRRYNEQIVEDAIHDMMDELDLEHDLADLSLGQEQMEVEPIREIAEYD